MALCIASCNTSEQLEFSHHPVQSEKDGRWGMINQKGEFLFQDEFENEPTSVLNGVFSVKEGNTYTIYEATKKPKVIADGFKEVGVLNEDLIPTVKESQRISIINKKGEQLFTLDPHNGKEIIACSSVFTDGLLAVADEDGKWGYVNKKGEMVIAPKYDTPTPFSDGLALVVKGDEENSSSSLLIINKSGEVKMEIKSKKFELHSSVLKNGLAVVEDIDKDRIGFINLDGEFIKVPKKVKSIKDYDSKVFTYIDENGKWGVMGLDEDFTEHVRAKYNEIQIISSDKFLVKEDKEYFIINKEGDIVLDFGDDYRQVSMFGSNFLVKEGSIYMILDGKKNKPINKNEYYGINTKLTKFGVESDYFDADGIAQIIADCISDKGVGQYTLGENTSKHLKGNPEDYIYTRNFFDEDNIKKGYNYTIVCGFESDEYLANSDGWGWNPTYSINQDAEITRTGMAAYLGKDGYIEQIEKKLISLLEEKGWKNNHGTLLLKGKKLTIESSDKEKVIAVFFTKDDSYTEPVDDVSNSGVVSETDASDKDEIYMTGKLNGKIEVKMVLDNAFNGFLYYTKSGYNTDIKVNGNLVGNQLTLTEKLNGQHTGTYKGNFDGNTFVGKFTRASDNKEFTFSFEVE